MREAGASADQAEAIVAEIRAIPDDTPLADVWARLTGSSLKPSVPFPAHRLVYDAVFSDWDLSLGPPPVWRPGPAEIEGSNVAVFGKKTGHPSFTELFEWSVAHRDEFWREVIDTLGIRFHGSPRVILDADDGPERAKWLPGARFNIADSCFNAPPDSDAVVYQPEGGELSRMTYDELDRLSNRVANSFEAFGLEPGDAVAVVMPMTIEAVAAYLGIVKAGCVVVSIAGSFAAEEIGTRLRIADVKAVVTQDVTVRGGKSIPLYQKIVNAGAERAVVVPAAGAYESSGTDVPLRANDVRWADFLVNNETYESVKRDPDDMVNVLFSSGTTGEPKAIPWTHTTPIKCAMDGYLHHDIKTGDAVAWPTNLGWMMGPWLIFASLINRATMALFYGSPVSREYCEFVRDARVSMLGLVPAVVRAWKATGAADGIDWSCIKVFSSTGEPSNPEDYLYLMSLAGYRPVIEYCGGTEIGGGFITGTVVQNASPSTFSTPSLGLDFYILDENGRPSDVGELFIVPPSIGLSNRLLNMDHHEVYYADTPKGPNGELLRRHGDEKRRLPGGYYRALGRADDTMNLGGIKVSSADIERAVAGIGDVAETAAIAVTPKGGGPSQMVIYAVAAPSAEPDRFKLRIAMQRAIAGKLNPLFKVHDVLVVEALPRTASNKVMRRVLRHDYETNGGRNRR
jgi:acetyl-CoA synthetase